MSIVEKFYKENIRRAQSEELQRQYGNRVNKYYSL